MCITSQSCIQQHHIASIKSVTMVVFTPQELANTTKVFWEGKLHLPIHHLGQMIGIITKVSLRPSLLHKQIFMISKSFGIPRTPEKEVQLKLYV